MIIDPYLAAFLVGAGGLTTMGLAGAGGRGAHALRGSHGAHAARGGGHAAAAHAPHHQLRIQPGRGNRWTLLLSPRVLFSVALGAGATGLIARDWIGGPLLAAAAVAGGLVLELLVVAPFWNFLFRFASWPAETLESVLFSTARVVVPFDQAGFGLVELKLDGQVRQVLAQLSAPERSDPAPHTGDLVRVEAVDAARQRLTVSRRTL